MPMPASVINAKLVPIRIFCNADEAIGRKQPRSKVKTFKYSVDKYKHDGGLEYNITSNDKGLHILPEANDSPVIVGEGHNIW